MVAQKINLERTSAAIKCEEESIFLSPEALFILVLVDGGEVLTRCCVLLCLLFRRYAFTAAHSYVFALDGLLLPAAALTFVFLLVGMLLAVFCLPAAACAAFLILVARGEHF